MKYTGKREGDYEFIKAFYTVKAELNLAIADLNKREKRARKDKEKKKDKKLISVISKGGEIPTSLTPSSKLYNKLVGKKTLYLQISVDGNIVVSEMINPRQKTGESIYWNNLYEIFCARGPTDGSEGYYVINPDAKRIRFVISESKKIPSMAIKQRFLDGFNFHCVLDGLIDVWTQTANNSISQSSKTRSNQIAKQLTRLSLTDYKDGCFEEDLDRIGKIASRKLMIHDIINNTIKAFNIKSTKSYHFTNTRKDHLETGEIFINQPFTQVKSQVELDNIINEHLLTDTFFHICGDIKKGTINSIKSVKGSWAIFNDDYELFNEFNKEHKIKEYTVDAIKNPELNEFCLRSRIINSAPTPLCDNPNDIEGCNHIDLEKAYTQHNKCGYYEGFLGHITECARFSNTIDSKKFLSSHLGIFKFKMISCSNLKLKLFFKTGISYLLPSPEIKLLMDNGCNIKITSGAWGNKFDIKYNEEMLKNRRYCIWAGKLGSQKEHDTFTFVGNQEWAQHLKATLGDEMVYFFKDIHLGDNKKSDDYIIVKKPLKSCKTNHHILAFITSYTRINMLNIILKIDSSKLIKVVLDGLYFRGDIPEVNCPHHLSKDFKIHNGFKNEWYNGDDFDESAFNIYNEELDCYNTPYNVIGLIGAGGNGKTHSVLANKNYINPLFIVPCHTLGRKAREQYGCNYQTIHKLIGAESVNADGIITKCLPIDYEPGTIFIDEATMIQGDWIDKAIKMYPNSRIFIAGDYTSDKWFQTRTGYTGNFAKIWKPKDYKLVEYNTDYRSKDNELKELKSYVRNCMNEIFTDGEQLDTNKISCIVKDKVKLTSFDDAVKMFKNGSDTFISGTQKMNDRLLSVGVVSGFINKRKEIVNVEEDDSVKRGSFTIHSYQGLTVSTGKVFITFDLFEYAMLYTAISRVINYDQLVFVV